MFAKEYGDLTNRADMIGLPLQANHLGQRQFARLIKITNVKAIMVLGMRHTCAMMNCWPEPGTLCRRGSFTSGSRLP